jgi:hypothetical protein
VFLGAVLARRREVGSQWRGKRGNGRKRGNGGR